ncbi:MAG: Clp protease N-terminal domain-containing protein, partial [bacterium]
MMMCERFNQEAKDVFRFANEEAIAFGHTYIDATDILLGLSKTEGLAHQVLKNRGVGLSELRMAVVHLVNSDPEPARLDDEGRLPQTPRAKIVIEYSIQEAMALDHNYVGPEHILLGLVREELEITDGVVTEIFKNLGTTLEEVREETLGLLGHGKETQ